MRPPVIIGGGPAGTTAALMLRQAGHPSILIERNAGPTDKPCGDFLAAAAIRAAESLGVSIAHLGGRPVTHLRLIRRARSTETPLPFQAMALPRHVLDAALLEACQRAGVHVLLGQSVPVPEEQDGDFTVDTAALGRISTGTVLLAHGRPTGQQRPSRRPPLSAYKMYFHVPTSVVAELAGTVELTVIPGGQVAVHAVGPRTLMLCLLSRRHDLDTPWDQVLAHTLAMAPGLARHLAAASPRTVAPLVAPLLPFGFLHRPRGIDHEGLYRVGDQAAFLSSLVADGVSVAMRGAMRATRTLLAGAGAGDYHRKLRAMLWPRVRLHADYQPERPNDPPRNHDPSITVQWNRLIA